MYNTIELEVKKWGNSLGIRITKALAEFLKIKEGSKIILTLKENRVEMRVADEEGRFIAPERKDKNAEMESEDKEELHYPEKRDKKRKRKRGRERYYRLEKINTLKLPNFEKPHYQSGLKRRKTPIKLRDEENLEHLIAKYPFVVVVFWDFLYLDFYDSIRRKINYINKLAEMFAGYCWFVVLNVEKYPELRKRYLGNAWSELEILGFVNGRKTFEGYTLHNLVPVLQKITGHYLSQKEMASLNKILTAPAPKSLLSEEELKEILMEHERILLLFQLPQDREFPRKIGRLLKHLNFKPYVASSYDIAWFNNKRGQFEENPLLKKLGINKLPSLYLFKKRKNVEAGMEIIEEKKVDGSLPFKKMVEEVMRFFGDEEEIERGVR